MNESVVEYLEKALEEALELRFGAAGDDEGPLVLPPYETGPGPFVLVLLRARRRADRIEELLARVKRVRGRLLARKKEAAEAEEDKMDAALREGAASKVEFSMGIERKAEASLKTFEEKRAARLAQKELDLADLVVDTIKDLHFGLAGWRNDVRDVIRTFQLESNLER